MLVTLKEILKTAEEKQIAIGAFNAPNLESLQAVTAAAEEMDLPVVIQFAQSHEIYNPVEVMRFTIPYMVIAIVTCTISAHMLFPLYG